MSKMGWNKTAVHYSTKKHESVRTTIPIAFANILGINKGDVLKWDYCQDGKYLTVKIVDGSV